MSLWRVFFSVTLLASGLLAIGCGKSRPSLLTKTTFDRDEILGKSTPDSVADVIGTVPGGFRDDFKRNKAVCEKMNVWLASNVDGKGQTIKGKVSATAGKLNKGVKGFNVKMELLPQAVDIYGVRWLVMFHDGSFKKRDRAPLGEFAFTFNDLNQKDGEWLAGLTEVSLEGTVKTMKVVPDDAEGSIYSVTLTDLKINGKPFKPSVQGK